MNSPGLYTVIYEDGNNVSCKTLDYLEITECVGKRSDIEGHGIRLYPNPTKESIVLERPIDCAECTLFISDMAGKVVLTTKLQEPINEVFLNNLSSGSYICQVLNQEGNRVFIDKRIIRE